MKRSVTAVLTALVLLLLIPACTASPGTDALTEGTLTGVPGTPDGGSDAPAATDAANTTEATTAEPTTLPPDPVQEALEKLTLAEKVGQLFIIRPDSVRGGDPLVVTPDMRASFKSYCPGGFILMGASVGDPEQLKTLTAALSDIPSVPPILAIDEEGGTVARIGNADADFGVPKFPSMGAVGDTGDPDEAWKAGRAIGAYLKDYGFTLDFAPVADVNSNPANPVIGRRAFSSDPYETAVMVEMFIDGLHESGVKSCIKHFPGHGDTYGDTHKGFVLLDKSREELEATELIPFRENVSHTDTVMIAHVALPQLTGDETPATLSKTIVTDLLRGELGFDGVVITDALEMGAITESYGAGEAAVLAFEAGCDLLLLPADFPAAYAAVLNALETGRIPVSRLDESVARILKLKGY